MVMLYFMWSVGFLGTSFEMPKTSSSDATGVEPSGTR